MNRGTVDREPERTRNLLKRTLMVVPEPSFWSGKKAKTLTIIGQTKVTVPTGRKPQEREREKEREGERHVSLFPMLRVWDHARVSSHLACPKSCHAC